MEEKEQNTANEKQAAGNDSPAEFEPEPETGAGSESRAKKADDAKSDSNESCAERLSTCEAERKEYLDGWKRARADFINYKRDEAKRFEELLQFGTARIFEDLIPVLSSFDLGIAALEKEGKAERGMYLIRSQLEDALKKHGFEKLSVAVGSQFDPALHEAVGTIVSDRHSPGSIAEVIEPGYLLHGKVVRPARVKVVKQ
jgi:molecular chaperone GrpE